MTSSQALLTVIGDLTAKAAVLADDALVSAQRSMQIRQMIDALQRELGVTPSQPGQTSSHAPAADTSTIPLVDETTDDAKGLSSLALASSVEPIQPSPLPGDSVDGAGIPPNRAPTPSAAFSAPGKIETALKAATKARRARLGVS